MLLILYDDYFCELFIFVVVNFLNIRLYSICDNKSDYGLTEMYSKNPVLFVISVYDIF